MKFNLILENALLLGLFCVIAFNLFSKDTNEKIVIEERVLFDKDGNIIEIDTERVVVETPEKINNATCDTCGDHNPDNDRAAGQCTYNMDCPKGYSCDSFGMCEQKNKIWK